MRNSDNYLAGIFVILGFLWWLLFSVIIPLGFFYVIYHFVSKYW